MLRDHIQFIIDEIMVTEGRKDGLPYVRFTLRFGIDEDFPEGENDPRFGCALYGCLATRTKGTGEETWFAPQSRGMFRWVPNVQIDHTTHAKVLQTLKDTGIFKKIPKAPYVTKKGLKAEIDAKRKYLVEKLVTNPGRDEYLANEKKTRKTSKKPDRRVPSTFDSLLNLKGSDYK